MPELHNTCMHVNLQQQFVSCAVFNQLSPGKGDFFGTYFECVDMIVSQSTASGKTMKILFIKANTGSDIG